MESVRFLGKKFIFSVMALSLLLLGIASSSMAVVVNADEVTNRSITLSDSTAGASNVSYNITFTVGSAGAGAYVLDFCDNSPIAGDTCTAPSGFDASGASVTLPSSGASVAELNSSPSTLLVTQTVASSATVNLELAGIHNPSYVTDTGAGDGFYMRVITYASASDASTNYTTATDLTDAVDTGGFAMSTTSAIGVSGTVNEYMTFCVANQTISQDCGDANDTGHFPNVTLGTDGVIDPSTIATGNIYTQISTNAASGAVIDLKSDATSCGGLRLGGTGACNIAPAPSSGFSAGTADFGVELNTPFGTTGDANDTGTLDPVGDYSTSNYYMNYVTGNATGVTSPYGDPILNTNSLPVNNENEELTFGASANPNTPAGNYSATLDMIATGTF